MLTFFGYFSSFKVSDSVEYFVKFEVPEDMIEIYEQNPERHIFQVNIFTHYKCKNQKSSGEC